MNAYEGSFDCINVDRHCEFLINVKVGFYLHTQEEQTQLECSILAGLEIENPMDIIDSYALHKGPVCIL